MVNIILNRTFWPVGHGAFYTEEHIFRSSNKAFCAVYDCGGKSKQIIEQQIDEFCASKGSQKIDYLFISHFHRDHINGVRYLLANVKVEHIVIPQLENARLIEAYIYNAITGANINDTQDDAQIFICRQLATRDIPVEQITEVESFKGERQYLEQHTNGRNVTIQSGDRIEVSDDNGNPYWTYIPINIVTEKGDCQDLLNALNKICDSCDISHIIVGGNIIWDSVDYLLNNKFKEVKQTYKDIFKENHNAYSMPVYSGPIEKVIKCHDVDFHDCDLMPYYMYRRYWHINERLHQYALKRMAPCLYMGDFEAKDSNNLCKLRKELNEYYYHIGMQQVPHHYSKNNHNIDLYEDRVIAFGNVDDHKDVSFCHSIYNEIQRETCFPPIVITENTPPLEFIARFWFR